MYGAKDSSLFQLSPRIQSLVQLLQSFLQHGLRMSVSFSLACMALLYVCVLQSSSQLSLLLFYNLLILLSHIFFLLLFFLMSHAQARMLNEEWERREQLEKLQEEQKLMLEQERHKREEFQQMKVRRTGGAEAHARAGETQEGGVPADEGK